MLLSRRKRMKSGAFPSQTMSICHAILLFGCMRNRNSTLFYYWSYVAVLTSHSVQTSGFGPPTEVEEPLFDQQLREGTPQTPRDRLRCASRPRRRGLCREECHFEVRTIAPCFAQYVHVLFYASSLAVAQLLIVAFAAAMSSMNPPSHFHSTPPPLLRLRTRHLPRRNLLPPRCHPPLPSQLSLHHRAIPRRLQFRDRSDQTR